MGSSVGVRYPGMRTNVIDALEMIANARNDQYWESRKCLDEYNSEMCVDILYNDCMIFPDPEFMLGDVITDDEVFPLRSLYEVYDPIVDKFGIGNSSGQKNDPGWNKVETRAKHALGIMIGSS